MFSLFKKRKIELDDSKKQCADQLQRITEALNVLEDAQHDFDEKKGIFNDQRFVAAMIAAAKKELGGCVYPNGPAGCSCEHNCRGKWPESIS